MQAHPVAVKNYLKAYFQAQRTLLDNSAKALLYLQQMLNVSVHTAGSAYSVYRGIWSRNGEPAKGTIIGTGNALTFIDPTITTPPPSSAYFDRRFLPATGK
jgi:ABC-type nitrate/sulfonate/bicarbonate transport system substrate-binding protein